MAKFRGVEGGTPNGTSLCRSCRHFIHIEGKAEGQEVMRCNRLSDWGSMPLLFEAYSCNRYDDETKPYLGDMYKTAWILASDKTSKERIGFVGPLDPRHKEIRNDEGYS